MLLLHFELEQIIFKIYFAKCNKSFLEVENIIFILLVKNSISYIIFYVKIILTKVQKIM